MSYQNKYIITIDNIQPEIKTISLAIEQVIVDESNNIVSKVSRNRCAFTPGQLTEVQQYIQDQAPNNSYQDVLDILNIMWTPQVIDNYNNFIQNNE